MSDDASEPTLAYVVVRCHDDTDTLVFGPETLEIRRGDHHRIPVMEIPAVEVSTSSQPGYAGFCHSLGVARAGPNILPLYAAFGRVAVSPDGSAVVFEVSDEFSGVRRNLSPEQEQIFLVRADGSGLRPLAPASRTRGAGQGFRFSPDGRRVVFNDKGPDHAGTEADQVIMLDIATETIGRRTQVTHLPQGPLIGIIGSVCCPRFIDNETIAFRTSVNADGLHPNGGGFTVKTDGTQLSALPIVPLSPGGSIDPNFMITGDEPTAVILPLEGSAENAHGNLDTIREVFFADGDNLLQLTNFGRVDTIHALLAADRQRVFFGASDANGDENPDENCQLFSVDVTGANLRQLTHFSDGQLSHGCEIPYPSPKPFGCSVRRFFQDPVTQTVVFFSTCDPFGTNPNGAQVFSVQPDGSELRQLTNLQGLITNADGTVSAELLVNYGYPGTSSAGLD